VKTDLGFLHIIQKFKIVGRETNNNKGFIIYNTFTANYFNAID